MENISKFFGIFKNKAVEHIHNRSVICEAFKKLLDQDMQAEDITIKDGVIKIKGSQGLKNEIYIKKKPLLDYIQGRAVNFKPIDIQ
ncbi:MAG: hypothetical protein V4697_03560 [Patescibacteria group bacterium]